MKKRYKNKNLIENSYASELLNIIKVRTESSKKIWSLVDNLLNYLKALKQLGLVNNHLSKAILMNIVFSNLDQESRKIYEMTLHCNKISNWDQLIEFLLKQSQILDNMLICTQTETRFYFEAKKFCFAEWQKSVPLM